MTPNGYQREAMKYEGIYQNAHVITNQFPDKPVGVVFRLTQGLMGLNGEAGEAIDILKKHLFQGHDLDREHLAKELGDVAWYLAVSADALGYSLEQILQMNIDKLRARYPDGFEVERSLHRAIKDE